MPYTSDWLLTDDYECPTCASRNVELRTWESIDGGHEDNKLHCMSCDHIWWSEGIDA